jgi:GntR family transcriptional regulator, gluconate operon transcriptional repressor
VSARPPGDGPGPAIVGLKLPDTGRTGRLARSLYSGSVVAALREAIVTGRLEAGRKLVESELARELEMSRGPIRSALAVLEAEGLVRSLPNGRMVVTGFDQSDVAGLFRVRLQLESTAVWWGVEEHADVSGIQAAFQEMRRGLDEAAISVERFVELDISFHRAVVAFGQSRFLLQAWLSLAPVLQTAITVGHRAAYGQFAESHRRRIVDAHVPLTEALVAYDAELAVKLLADQMADAESVLRVDQEQNSSRASGAKFARRARSA